MHTRFVLVGVLCLISGSNLLAQQASQNQATIAYVHSLARPDGGYAVDAKTTQSNLTAVTAAIRALKYFGDKPANAEATGKFVASCHDQTSGGFGDAPGKPPTAIFTAHGIMDVIDLNLPVDRYRDRAVKFMGDNAKTLEDIRVSAASFEAMKIKAPKADDWLQQVAKTRNRDGTFGEGTGVAKATGGMAVTTLRLGGTLENRDAVLRALRAGQRQDGGFGSAEKPESDLASTYQIMRALMMLKEQPSDPAKLRAFIARCRNGDGGFGASPGQPSTASTTYYSGIVQFWLGPP
jgi:prenyltransferase beta subunit